MSDPVPFEIADIPEGGKVATNGQATLQLLDAGGRVFRRRAVKTTPASPPALAALPMVNELAGHLLAAQDMDAGEIAERLNAIAAAIAPPPQQRIEWAVAELDGVRCYFDGLNVVVTRQDLMP